MREVEGARLHEAQAGYGLQFTAKSDWAVWSEVSEPGPGPAGSEAGDTLILWDLARTGQGNVPHVAEWQLTADGGEVLFLYRPSDPAGHGLHLFSLTDLLIRPVAVGEGRYFNPRFDETGRYLTFWSDRQSAPVAEDEGGVASPGSESPLRLWEWDRETRRLTRFGDVEEWLREVQRRSE